MANILIYIELAAGKPTPASLSALNEGRLAAGRLGATLYALLPCAAPPTYGDNDIITVLACHGADKVILLTHPELPDRLERQSEALNLACSRFPPRLLLMAASRAGERLAPQLSIHLGGEYWSLSRLQAGESDGASTGRRMLSAMDSLREAREPLVITLEEPGEPRCLGDEEAEVIVLHLAE